MKAINDNGTIKKFNSVPKTWGKRIGLQYASDSDLEAIGFYDVEEPAKNESQEYGDIEWDATNSRFTYPVNNKTYSQTVAELKEEKIKKLKRIYGSKLGETDWIIVRDQELGNTTDSQVLTDRAALRTECTTKEAEINALSTKSSVVDYSLPSVGI